MTQLELDLRPSLTVQYDLPLDYTPCNEYRSAFFTSSIITGATGSLDLNSGIFTTVAIPTPAYTTPSIVVGGWEISKHDKEPSKMKKFFAKTLLGWTWKRC